MRYEEHASARCSLTLRAVAVQRAKGNGMTQLGKVELRRAGVEKKERMKSATTKEKAVLIRMKYENEG